MSHSLRVVINFVLFQIGWFVCVLSAVNNSAWIGITVVTLIVLWHLFQAHTSVSAITESLLLVIALLTGLIWESLLLHLQLVSYPSHPANSLIAPVWILALWPLFATTFNLSLRWMKNKLALAAVFGFVGGPLSFYAGHKLGGVNFHNLTISMITLAIAWAILVPAMLYISRKLDGFKQPVQVATYG